jgi:DNA-binding HxlR family transcriptional regulator
MWRQMTFVNRPEKLKILQTQLRVLSQKHTLKIIAFAHLKPTYMRKIADETRIPYTTLQKRMQDLEAAGLIRKYSEIDKTTGKIVTKIRLERFSVILDINNITDLVYGARSLRYQTTQ